MSRLLLLDSGVGGLTVAANITERLPKVSIDYVADNGFYPYGTKTEQALFLRLTEIISMLSDTRDYQAIVIACNSASTLVLDRLRAKFTVPIIGVVPAIKPAALASRARVIGLLATEATVRGQYVEQLIRTFAADCRVIKVASQALVELAERKLHGAELDIEQVLSIAAPFAAEGVDVVVLGCTHFPWFRDELAAAFPQITWVDSGAAIARRVQSILQSSEHPPKLMLPEFRLYYSGEAYPATMAQHFAATLQPLVLEKSQH